MAKLVFLCDTYPPNIGGSENILCNLARGAAERGHAVTVLTPRSGEESRAEAEFDAGEPYTIARSALWRMLYRIGGAPGVVCSRIARALIIPLVMARCHDARPRGYCHRRPCSSARNRCLRS